MDQRCVFLFTGDSNDSQFGISMDMLFANPDDPELNQNAQIKVQVSTLIVEHSSDVVLSLTKLVTDFGNLLRYDDLFSNPYRIQDSGSLYRKINLWVPLYYIKTKMISCHDTHLVSAYQQELLDNKIQDLGVFENCDLLSNDDFLDQEFQRNQLMAEHAHDDNYHEYA